MTKRINRFRQKELDQKIYGINRGKELVLILIPLITMSEDRVSASETIKKLAEVKKHLIKLIEAGITDYDELLKSAVAFVEKP